MADKRGVATLGPIILRVQSGRLFTPNEFAKKIENMFAMEEGTLRSVWGPATFVPSTSTGLRPLTTMLTASSIESSPTSVTEFFESTATSRGDISPTTPAYGARNHGIYH